MHNVISDMKVQDFQSFIRLSLKVKQAPDYVTSPAYAPRQPVIGELLVRFSATALDMVAPAMQQFAVDAELAPIELAEAVELRVRTEKPFRFNAFYYAPQKVFIVDIIFDNAIPESVVPQKPAQQARLSLERGDTTGALFILQKIIAASPMDAEANYHLGIVRAARGDLEMARQNFLRATKSDSTFLEMVEARISTIDERLAHLSPGAAPQDPALSGRSENPPVIVAQVEEKKTSVPVAASRTTRRARALLQNKSAAAAASPGWMETMRKKVDFDLSPLVEWAAGNRALLWRASLLLAVLGSGLLFLHFRPGRKPRRRHTQPRTPDRFAALFADRLSRTPEPAFDLRSFAGQEEKLVADLFTRNAGSSPFDLPAPVHDPVEHWPGEITTLSAQEISVDGIEAVAQKLQIGQGEVELYLYLNKRNAGSRAEASGKPRLIILE